LPLRFPSAKPLVVASIVLIASLAGAQSQEAAIKSMFDRQISTLTKGDVEGYMSTIDPSIPQYGQTKKTMAFLFSKFKLKTKLESFKVLSISGSTAKVSMVVLTTKVSGPEFRNNRVSSVNTVMKKNGKWVTSATKVTKFEYLD
jgi:hypothetical protein